MLKHLLWISSFLVCSAGIQAAQPEPFATIAHPPLGELSGLARSGSYPGVFWGLNDSGDEARLFALREDGSVLMPPFLGKEYFSGQPVEGKKAWTGVQLAGAVNMDFEDLASDGDTLYVPDMGNNGNARRDLGVYVLPEPNPLAVGKTRPMKWLPVVYPDQKAFPGTNWHFDCEASFVFKNKLYFLTKWRGHGNYGEIEDGTALYRLDSAHTDRPNRLVKVQERTQMKGWVTGASLSPDGKTLAVLCEAPERAVWLFRTPAKGDKLLSKPVGRMLIPDAGQCEAISFVDDGTILVGNEGRQLFRLRVGDFEALKPRAAKP